MKTKKSEAQKLRRTKLNEAGLCIRCGSKPSRDHRTLCEECAQKAKLERQAYLNRLSRDAIDEMRQKSNMRAKARYYKLKGMGLCVSCGVAIAINGTKCAACRDKYNERRRRNNAYRRRTRQEVSEE